ncbi:MAG: WYL domain-containing protein, partial [Victivallales bacterium]|nr:WYL domain-containing protein [Victivallales bacterium]
LHTCQTIEPDNKPGWYILTVPEASPERIVPWVFAQKGEAVPLSPNGLVEEVRKQERHLAKAIGAI